MFWKIILSLSLLPVLSTVNWSAISTAGETAPDKIVEESLGIATTAEAVLVMDAVSGEILFAENFQKILPIASLTKIMSALVFLESKPDWEREVEILAEDDRAGGKLYVGPGETMTVRDLFYSSLVGSANNATVTLARLSSGRVDDFVGRMNKKAEELGLENTYFTDPTGLDATNISTVHEIALIFQQALAEPLILEALLAKEYVFETINTKQSHTIHNTNKLLETFLNESPYTILGGKTGYLDEIGYCLVAAAEDDEGQRVIAVVLGNTTQEARFQETKELLYWALSNFQIIN